MKKIRDFLVKIVRSLRRDGLKGFLIKAKNWTIFHLKRQKLKKREVKDILFINGCALPHPERYRVDHQMEQLAASGMKVDKIYSGELSLDLLKYYRGFVIFRCPITPQVAEFIEQAKYFNKKVFFDIDDLVVNRKFTDTNEYVQQMGPREKWGYDMGVVQMEETLKKCDYLITSTTGMAGGLEMYDKEIYVNRNTVSEEMVKLSLEAIKKVKKDSTKVVVGYLSGSITHNPDMELVKPALLRLMRENKNVELLIAGILDVPEELKEFGGRVRAVPFGDWRKLPETIASLDINLAPLTKTIFNEAKSENKWTEAALCKVVTVASDLGAFREVVEDGKTGVLCKNSEDWYIKLRDLVDDPEKRQNIAESAYDLAMKKYITTYTGHGLMEFIESKLAPNLAMILPSTDVSGGIMVALKHCHILREYGYDVTVLNMDSKDDNVVDRSGEINVVNLVEHDISARFDTMVATMYTTLDFAKRYPEVKRIVYLVQGKEIDFYEYGVDLRSVAGATYNEFRDIEYVTISKWCEGWLKEDYGREVKYAPNGINVKDFAFRERKMGNGEKIKVLIEGDSRSFYKNIDESFRIVERLDKDKFEIIYLSYQGEPKSWYRVDRFYHKVPHDEVGEIYAEADILLKSSILESFSYPPLEMMATGGYVVAAPNEGNVEYLRDEVNCLFYERGDVAGAVRQIERLIKDGELRKRLASGAKKTVEGRDWSKIEKRVVKLYGDSKKKRLPRNRRIDAGNNAALELYADVDERKKLIDESLKKGKKIALYLVENKLIAQFRYRCQNTMEVTLDGNEWQAVYFVESEMALLEKMLPKCEMLVIERQSAWRGPIYNLINACKVNNVKVIYDVDDLVFDVRDVPTLMRSVNSKNLLYWIGYVLGVRKIAKRADGFLVTNNFLGKRVEASFGKPYKIIRNSLNIKQLEVSKKHCGAKKKVFRVGYFSGTPTHVRDLRLVLPELKKFLSKHEDTVVEVVGFMDLGEEGQNLLNEGKMMFLPPVDFVTLQELMSEVDVNIAPLVVNDFTNCKSELKFFEAAVVETTTIASPTYTFERAIMDGKNGYLAQPGEWYDKLEYLYQHPEKNREVALAAKKYALENYYGKEFLKEVNEAYDYFAK